ncbi:MAG TPA: feruloyl-CoA synthase [Polyangiaceae bacterium]|jgi:feruloyl-CoA synthase
MTSPRLAPAAVHTDRRPDGSIVLRSAHALGDYPRHLSEPLRHWARQAPDRTFLAERTPGGGWRRVTYAQARDAVDRLAQSLLDRGLDASRPLMILSGNGVDHALLTMAAMQAGVPAAPISTAYSLVSRDFGKLRAIHQALDPGLVFAGEADRYARAFAALGLEPSSVVTDLGPLLRTTPTEAMERRYASLGPDSVAKILFTSGSTGEPKGVINTQRMLCSNQQAIATVWPFLHDRPPVLLDWLPWSHTFGANHNFNMVLFHGGSLFVDDGRPTPDLIERTCANLREISPTLTFNVPRGFAVLLPKLEQDPSLRDALFRELDVCFYAAASLPSALWERLEALSVASRGEKVLMFSAWGSTETSPLATTVHFRIDRAGVIGLPAPGTEIKLAPVGAKLELRVKGPNVTPGYWGRPDLAATAFDEEGFLRMGDGGKLADPEDPARGVVFDGRIGEDFKLSSGTWVHVGALCTALVARLAPTASDAVIAGLDRDAIGVLLFVGPPARLPETRERLRELLRAHNAEHPNGSQRVARALLMEEPPSIDATEVTDKGYINQRAVLERRSALVERMYRGEGQDVILLD